MMKRAYAIAAGLLMLAAATNGRAQPAPTQFVTGYLGITVRTYVQNGTPNGELPISSLPSIPPGGIPVTGHDDKGHPGIGKKNGTSAFFLKPADILMTDTAKTSCTKMVMAGKPAGFLAASGGVSAGASEHHVPCT
jgi:hypothetical protein